MQKRRTDIYGFGVNAKSEDCCSNKQDESVEEDVGHDDCRDDTNRICSKTIGGSVTELANAD